MFQKRTLIIVFVIVALGLAFGTFLSRSNRTKPEKKVEASSASATITTQVDWDAGTKENIDSSTSAGSIEISTKNQGTEIFSSSISSCWDQTSTPLTVDGDTSTYWGNVAVDPLCSPDITYDFADTKTFGRIGYVGTEGYLFYSTDNANWSIPNPIELVAVNYPPGTMEYTNFTPFSARYIKVSFAGLFIREIDFFTTGATATHTTGTTQIDGGANFWQWENFTDNKTTPANTSVTYRYRSSTNGSDWTAWVGAIGSVTSRTGDDSNDPTKYRYLQIEATLSNTDGTSTPTIDSYSIGYHTNQKPNAPTAMTAVIN